MLGKSRILNYPNKKTEKGCLDSPDILFNGFEIVNSFVLSIYKKAVFGYNSLKLSKGREK